MYVYLYQAAQSGSATGSSATHRSRTSRQHDSADTRSVYEFRKEHSVSRDVFARAGCAVGGGEFTGGDAGDVYDDHGAHARDRDSESDGRVAWLHRWDYREGSDTDQCDRVGSGVRGFARGWIFDSQSLRV